MLRPLGKIVGICLKPKPEPKKKEEPVKAPEKNAFWEMAGYKDDGKPMAIDTEEPPRYDAPMQILKHIIHTGIMKRVKLDKEKMNYTQIIYPNPSKNDTFVGAYFNAVLP